MLGLSRMTITTRSLRLAAEDSIHRGLCGFVTMSRLRGSVRGSSYSPNTGALLADDCRIPGKARGIQRRRNHGFDAAIRTNASQTLFGIRILLCRVAITSERSYHCFIRLCRSSWLDQRCLPLVDTTLLVVVMPLLWRSLAALASLRFGGWEGNPTREPDVARESTPGPSAGVPPPVVACVHPPTPAREGHP